MISSFSRSGMIKGSVLALRSQVSSRKLLQRALTEGGSTRTQFDQLVSEKLYQALSTQSFTYATPIQSMSYPAVRSGNDVVIGAETGSGKTLAYLMPIIDEILSMADPPVLDFPLGFILTPNKELCNQVEQMAQGLVNTLKEHGSNIRIEAQTELAHGWRCVPGAAPHFVICTPRFLSNFVRGPVIREEELFRNIHCLVLDEADMLLDGSYLRDVEVILDALKVTRRGLIREGVLQVHEKRTQYILSAATIPSFGLRSVQAFVNKRFPAATFVRTDSLHMHHPCIKQEFVQVLGIGDVDNGSRKGSPEHVRAVVRAILSNKNSAALATSADAPPEQALTVGNAQVENDIVGVTSNPVLISKSTLSFHDSASSQTDLSSEEVHAANSLDHLVMVFLNTAEDAQRFAEEALSQGVQCAQFHSLLGSAQRAESLRRFRQGSARLLVCTDSAARGLDLPQVRHVVQADFALNVVQHQHRVGRASRAGRAGKATNFYWGARASALVESILGMSVARKRAIMEAAGKLQVGQQHAQAQTEEQDQAHAGSVVFHADSVAELPGEGLEAIVPDHLQSIDQSFSRRRGFRRNLKRFAKASTV